MRECYALVPARLGEWLHGHRLYSLNMNGYSVEEGEEMVRLNVEAMEKAGF